jgi:hypothetical protein
MVDIDVIADADDLADWLWDQVLRRSVEIGAKSQDRFSRFNGAPAALPD